MAIKIMTDDKPVKVWRSDKYDKPRYSIGISKKEGDTWVKAYQQVEFKKGVEVHNGQDICIKNAFPIIRSWVKDDQQFVKVVWMITEFDSNALRTKVVAETVPQTVDNQYQMEIGSFSSVDEDIPF